MKQNYVNQNQVNYFSSKQTNFGLHYIFSQVVEYNNVYLS